MAADRRRRGVTPRIATQAWDPVSVGPAPSSRPSLRSSRLTPSLAGSTTAHRAVRASRSARTAARRTRGLRPARPRASSGDRDRLDDLEVDLDLGLGAAGPHDDPRAVGEQPAQTLRGRQAAVAPAQVVARGSTADPGDLGGGLVAQPRHQGLGLREVADPHREGVGRVHAVGAGEVVEQVEQGAALGLEPGGQLGEEQRGAHAVLVADEVGGDAVAEGLLVAVAQARARGRST